MSKLSKFAEDGWSFIPEHLLPLRFQPRIEFKPDMMHPHGLIYWKRSIVKGVAIYVSGKLKHAAGQKPVAIMWHPLKSDRVYVVDAWDTDPANEGQLLDFLYSH